MRSNMQYSSKCIEAETNWWSQFQRLPFETHFLHRNCCILISLNKAALVQLMTLHRPDDKSLFEPVMASFTDFIVWNFSPPLNLVHKDLTWNENNSSNNNNIFFDQISDVYNYTWLWKWYFTKHKTKSYIGDTRAPCLTNITNAASTKSTLCV